VFEKYQERKILSGILDAFFALKTGGKVKISIGDSEKSCGDK